MKHTAEGFFFPDGRKGRYVSARLWAHYDHHTGGVAIRVVGEGNSRADTNSYVLLEEKDAEQLITEFQAALRNAEGMRAEQDAWREQEADAGRVKSQQREARESPWAT